MAVRHLFPQNTGVWGRFGVLESLNGGVWGEGKRKSRKQEDLGYGAP